MGGDYRPGKELADEAILAAASDFAGRKPPRHIGTMIALFGALCFVGGIFASCAITTQHDETATVEAILNCETNARGDPSGRYWDRGKCREPRISP